jgi:hypothetical protein
MKLDRLVYGAAYVVVSALLLLLGVMAWLINWVVEWKNLISAARRARPVQPANKPPTPTIARPRRLDDAEQAAKPGSKAR